MPVPATAEQLAGPWRPTPLSLGAEIRKEVDEACRADPAMPDGLTLMVMDARGAGRLAVQYAGAEGSAAFAEATIGADQPTTCILRSTTGQSDEPPMADRELRWAAVSGGSGVGAWWTITGRAGASIDQVIAEVPGSPPITATMAEGWFALWWDGQGPPVRLIGLDGGGAEAAELEIP